MSQSKTIFHQFCNIRLFKLFTILHNINIFNCKIFKNDIVSRIYYLIYTISCIQVLYSFFSDLINIEIMYNLFYFIIHCSSKIGYL